MRVAKYLYHKGFIPNVDYVGKTIKAPYRDDNNPSLLIYRTGKSFMDLATGEKGGVVELIKLIEGAKTTSEALDIYNNVTREEPKPFTPKYISVEDAKRKGKTKYKDELYSVSDKITDKELLAYLRDRGIVFIPHWLKEVHLKRGKFINKYVGLKNLSGGYNLRNRDYKKGFNKNDITVAQIGTSDRVAVFEGLFDALSWVQDMGNRNDTIIFLNSTSNIKKFIERAKQSITDIFILNFDNGIGGDMATIKVKIELGEKFKIKDNRVNYKDSDDYNDHIRGIKSTEEKKIRIAYNNEKFYIKQKSKSFITILENCTLKQIQKEFINNGGK